MLSELFKEHPVEVTPVVIFVAFFVAVVGIVHLTVRRDIAAFQAGYCQVTVLGNAHLTWQQCPK